MAEPPYGVIWDCMKAGQVVPFLGSGASLTGRPPNACWEGEKTPFLPKSSELSDFLATQASFPSEDPKDKNDLAKVCSYYTDVSGRGRLRKALRRLLLNKAFQPGELHKFLASVPLNAAALFPCEGLEVLFRQIGVELQLCLLDSVSS